MKINYKNTALGFLDGSQEIDFGLPEGSDNMSEPKRVEFLKSVHDALKRNNDLFKGNVRYISDSFFKAYEKSTNKLKEVFDKQPVEESGTFVWSSGSFTTTVFYALITTGTGDEWNFKLIYLQFSKYSKNDFINLDVCILADEGSYKSFVWSGHTKNGRNDMWWSSFLITLITFIKYCEIETKIIPSGRKDKCVGIKYLNETKTNIQILDSTWFTTIIKSEGFGVSGHFRWQPYPTSGEKKLIWIAAYEKEGYTRVAKVENERNQTNK